MITAERYEALLGGPDVALYQPLEHPYFAGREAIQPCEERWELMQTVDLPESGECVDIGCNTGWFCRKFSHNNWHTTGIDTKEAELDIARNLMRPYDGRAGTFYYRGDIANIPIPLADLTLCLSVVMYWFNPEFGKTQDEAWDILQRISLTSPRMFLDFGGRYNTLGPEFPEQVLTETAYTTYQLLGHTALEDRPFYYFTRGPVC